MTGGRRVLAPLGLVFLIVGLANSLVVPFISLFLATEVHATAVQTTVILVAYPVSAVVAAWAVGRVSDRWPVRRPLMVGASLAGLIGMGLTAVVRDYWVLLAVTVTATAAAGVLFPQTFAFAREVLAQRDPKRAALGISVLRTVFSIAWVAGPPVAAALLAVGGFPLVYGAAAAMYGLAAVVAFRLPDAEAPAPAPASTDADGPAAGLRFTILLTIVAFVLLQTPLNLGGQAVALFTTEELGGTVTDAGLILGLCAALEIPLMLGLGVLSTRVPLRVLILLGAAAGIAYQAMAAASHEVWQLAAAQLFNALFIAAISALGIPYVQDLMPDRPGHATTMSTNTFPMGQIVAGPLFGLAQSNGYRLAYVMSLGLCVLGFLLLLATRPRPPAQSPE
ncbi:sugar efflux transporter SetB [Virgisporangium aurantiacum]|uniref:Sugar efflux transporter SetB n=1 Tax=Virgisporangium aurantiacum TaxID=175570 RepID=A0A8J3ZF41_9ACTN|nr:sugar efflux transporter SetB [Virgisporangium aurantiacum]